LENNGDTMSQSRILINISKAFWNKIPDGIRYELLEMALDIPGLSPRVSDVSAYGTDLGLG